VPTPVKTFIDIDSLWQAGAPAASSSSGKDVNS
jgi:hypothetical protein